MAHPQLDLVALEAMLGRLEELASASGAAEVLHRFTAYDTPLAAHLEGTCLMGVDPRSRS